MFDKNQKIKITQKKKSVLQIKVSFTKNKNYDRFLCQILTNDRFIIGRNWKENEVAEKPGPDLCLFINYNSVFYCKTNVR